MQNIIRFSDYISLKNYRVDKAIRNKILDSVLESIDKQKNEKSPEEIIGLQVKTRATHAGRLTSHMHFYMPAAVRDAVSTWTTPYNKPVLRHHNVDSDAIGRVVNAEYIATPPLEFSSTFTQKFYDIKNWSEEELKDLIDTAYPVITRKDFEGFGYIQLTLNITDPDAIEKIIDGRYHTLSVGYNTDKLLCSICYQDWLSEGVCEHFKGGDYDGKKMFWIFGNLKYKEISYVNTPADELAMNESYEPIRLKALPYTQSSSSAKDSDSYNRTIEVFDIYFADELDRLDSSKIEIFLPSKDSTKNNNEDTMSKIKLTTLKRSKDLYSRIAQYVPEEKRLTKEQLDQLKDDDFVGSKRLFPAIDLEHIEAAKKVLEEVEDCAEKEQLLKFLQERAELLNSNDTDESEQEKQVVENQETNKEEVESNVSNDTSSAVSDTQQQSEQPDENNVEAEAAPTLYIKDNTFEFAGLWNDELIKKAIMFLLDKLTDKDSAVNEIAKDKISEVTEQLDNANLEIAALKKVIESKKELIKVLSNKLKDEYVNSILQFKIMEDPEKSIDQLKDHLRSQKLSDLETTLLNLKMLFGEKRFVPAIADNDVKQFADTDDKVNNLQTSVQSKEITQEEIERLKRERDKTYSQLLVRDSVRAQIIYDKMTEYINELESKLNSNNS